MENFTVEPYGGGLAGTLTKRELLMGNLRLAERIRSMPYITERLEMRWSHLVDQNVLNDRLRSESKMIGKIPVVLADEIAAMYFESPQDEWCIVAANGAPSDFPNIVSPWPIVFIEWNEPKTLIRCGERLKQEQGQAGVFVITFDLSRVSAEERKASANHLRMISTFGGSAQWPTDLSNRYMEALGKSRWFMFMSMWYTFYARPFLGQPGWSGAGATIFVSPSGEAVDWFPGGPAFACHDDQATKELMNSPAHIALLTMSFLHCKNVVTSDNPTVTDKKWLRRKKLVPLQYKILNLHPMRDTLRSNGQSQITGLKRAMHICRGHFAKYGEESAGLFGKYHGTFWIPQHTRGSKAYGEIVKDYKMNL